MASIVPQPLVNRNNCHDSGPQWRVILSWQFFGLKGCILGVLRTRWRKFILFRLLCLSSDHVVRESNVVAYALARTGAFCTNLTFNV